MAEHLRTHSRSFTLVELLIVMIILGILAAIVIPPVRDYQRDSEQVAFITALRTLVDAAILYGAQMGEPLPDADSGEVPRGFGEYIEEKKWTSRTPIGGLWDSVYSNFGITSGLGVDYAGAPADQRKDDGYLSEIDAAYDDGRLESGRLRMLTRDRFIYVIQE